jgi:predicted transcriptional regulator
MSRDITVLEGIVEDIQRAIFQKWANELPEDQRTEEVLEPLATNAAETVLYVIQMYMDKINEAADQLKDS